MFVYNHYDRIILPLNVTKSIFLYISITVQKIVYNIDNSRGEELNYLYIYIMCGVQYKTRQRINSNNTWWGDACAGYFTEEKVRDQY